MGITIFKLELPEIKLCWERLRRRMRFYTVDKYTGALTSLVTRSREEQSLFVSVGEADYLAQWLGRLYQEPRQAGSREPRISKLIIKRLSDPVISRLQEADVLRQGFGEGLRANLQTLRSIPGIIRNRVEIEERLWNRLPSFHGYLFGDSVLVGPWAVDEAGYLHVQTPLLETKRAAAPSHYEWVRSQFENEG